MIRQNVDGERRDIRVRLRFCASEQPLRQHGNLPDVVTDIACFSCLFDLLQDIKNLRRAWVWKPAGRDDSSQRRMRLIEKTLEGFDRLGRRRNPHSFGCPQNLRHARSSRSGLIALRQYRAGVLNQVREQRFQALARLRGVLTSPDEASLQFKCLNAVNVLIRGAKALKRTPRRFKE